MSTRSKAAELIAECLVSLLVIIAVACLVVWMPRSEEIPPEPVDQQTEAVPDGWGEPRSSKWSAVRAEHVQHHPDCIACGSRLQLNVHHVQPFHVHPELELEPSNLVTMCREHHFRIGHDPDGPWGPIKPGWSKSNPRVREDSKRWATEYSKGAR